jgi:hypothetical protein
MSLPTISREEEDRLKLDFVKRLHGCGAQAKKIGRKRKATDRPTRGYVDYSRGVENLPLSVPPAQVEERRALTKQLGLSGIAYSNDGICTVTSRRDKNIFMAHIGQYDRDAGYGDHAK